MLQYPIFLIFSVVSFLYGFFPVSRNTANFSNDPPTRVGNLSVDTQEFYHPHFDKTILIVIDALRWDFATSELMPLTLGHTSRRGCISKVSVESPTVTLPRIKAMTTGSVPQYIDIIRNLASSEILSDSWLHSAKKKGLRTVFYGDNTWEKLFPDFFERSEGTTSYFVWDFTEVDDNVTRNVDLELKRTDWDLMILHYLGLDHIGHVFGPFSSKIPLKLKEMDEIIHKITTNNNDTLILVTGDHGMRDGGGHGGTSYPEITVPLITIGHKCQDFSFLQTDIPGNMAVLLGLNIPSTSIGKIQRAFLGNLSMGEYLFALLYNAEILLKKINLCGDKFINATNLHEQYLRTNNSVYADAAAELYQECSDNITSELYESSSKQDLPLLVLIILVMVNTSLVITLDLLKVTDHVWFNLELAGYFSMVFMQQFFFCATSSIFLLILTILAIKKLKQLILVIPMGSFRVVHLFPLVICMVHPITFMSTSFIEEEHYFWIFSSVTFILLYLIEGLDQLKGLLKMKRLILVLIVLRFSMDLNATEENSVQKGDNWANILMAEENYVYHQSFFAVGLVLVFFTFFEISILDILVLIFIFVLKSGTYHNTFLGKLIWGIIFFRKMFSSWEHFWIMCSVLLLKPHNVILVPFSIYICKEVVNLKKLKNVSTMPAVHYMLSNCFYFLQGHRNSLASIDVSVGYIGLNDYYPFLVVAQILVHTYAFPVLFHLIVLKCVPENEQKYFWLILLVFRSTIMFFTCTVTVMFRHHLFVWSVFAPKLFIESVHTSFLFIEICFWYFHYYVTQLRFFLKL